MSSSVVRKLDESKGRGLRDALEAAGFEFASAPYARWTAKGPGVSVAYYESGKLVVQGKGAQDFAAAYLDDPDEVLSQRSAAPEDRVTEPIVGTDESGKGDYFCPLVVAAMLVKPEDVPVLLTLGVRDSKTVGDSEATEMARQLLDAYPSRCAVVCVNPQRYNELYGDFGGNLNRLLAWGHAQAIEDVLQREPCRRVLSDKFGNERLIADALKRKGIDVRLEQRVRAESHPAVAAASILARARFLRELRRLGEDIGVKLHKGAGVPVDAVARDLWRRGGIEMLGRVAKLHFKTTEKTRP